MINTHDMIGKIRDKDRLRQIVSTVALTIEHGDTDDWEMNRPPNKQGCSQPSPPKQSHKAIQTMGLLQIPSRANTNFSTANHSRRNARVTHSHTTGNSFIQQIDIWAFFQEQRRIGPQCQRLYGVEIGLPRIQSKIWMCTTGRSVCH